MEYVKLVLFTGRKDKFNFNKCSFCIEKVHFFGLGKNGVEVEVEAEVEVEVDKEKVKVISDLPTPKSASKVRSFYGLASFYKRLILVS